MKIHNVTAAALLIVGSVFTAAPLIAVGSTFAAEAPALGFGGERIGVPPLSLAESIAQGAAGHSSLPFSAKSPHASRPETLPTPNLIPRITPEPRQLEKSRVAKSPRVSRSFGMPIIEPSDAVDYKLTIAPPNPAVDFKLVIRDPPPPQEAAATK